MPAQVPDIVVTELGQHVVQELAGHGGTVHHAEVDEDPAATHQQLCSHYRVPLNLVEADSDGG